MVALRPIGELTVDNSNWRRIPDTYTGNGEHYWTLVDTVPPEGGPALPVLQHRAHFSSVSFIFTSGESMSWPDGQGIGWEVRFPYTGPGYTLTVQAGTETLAVTMFGGPGGTIGRLGYFYNGVYRNLYTPNLDNTFAFQLRRVGNVAVLESVAYGPGRATKTVTEVLRTGDMGDFTGAGQGWFIYVTDVNGFQDWYYLAGIGAAPKSVLMQQQADGSYVLVGTAERPFHQQLPDGSLRTWPGSSEPLYQRQPDGSYAVVIEGG